MLIDIVTNDCKNLHVCLFKEYDFFTEFLTSSTKNTIVILIETWLNGKYFFPENFLCPKHKFYSKSRSSKTRVNKGGDVAIWIPRDISSNDLNVPNENSFESLWAKISGLSVNKILINASYCPNKNLINFNRKSDIYGTKTVRYWII